jgi:tetrapyrrole methylase family protein / MazG family protein
MLGTRAVPNAFPVVNSYHVPYSFSFAREPIRTVSPRQPKKKKSQPTKRKRQKSARRQTGKLFEDLVALQARLRAPGGCPWDREQTHQTLKTYLIEEAYEVLDALEHGNANELTEELGDLLLQILFHSDIGREAGRFDIADVISGIHEKMVRRHPHVFGTVKADTPEQVLKNWAQLKAQEKRVRAPLVYPESRRGARRDAVPVSLESAPATQILPSALEGIPRSLPALLEAYQLTRRAAQVGFDWEDVEGIFTKLLEETSELRVALSESDRSRREEEIGDLLFVVVNLSRFLGFDPEVVLKHSNLKFKSRFQHMEEDAARSGQRLAQLSKEELEVLWDSAKKYKRDEAARESTS